MNGGLTMKQTMDSSIRRQLSPFLRTGRQRLTGKQPLIGEEKKATLITSGIFQQMDRGITLLDGPVWNRSCQ